MIYCTVLEDGKQKQVTINQKQICSFQEIEIGLNSKKAIELRMSNGDVWIVLSPDYTSWIPDAFISGNEY